MAAGSFQPIEPFSQVIHNRGTISVPEKASGTWGANALLVLNGGYVEEAGTAPSTVKYVATRAGQNGATDGAKTTEVWPITTDALWVATQLELRAQADLGSNFGLVLDATTKNWYVSSADTADQVTVEGFIQTPDLGAIGDTKARVLIRFQSANIAGA